MSEQHAGSCLCGQVKFEVEGAFDRFFLCHCTYCQKDTGSAHAANLFSFTGSLKWLSGQDKVVMYNLPSTRHTKSFCGTCGSAVPTSAGGKFIVVPAGSLDTVVTLKPTAHIFVASRAGWDHDLESVPSHDKFPT